MSTKYIRNIDGDLNCICGNNPYNEGLQPCLRDGTEVEPVVGGPWDGRLYVCLKCGRIADQYTLQVIGTALGYG